MEIKVCRTNEWSDAEWEQYVSCFDEVFTATFTIEDFKAKYAASYLGYSFHSLLLSAEGKVVGGVSVIPCKYMNGNMPFVTGVAVDLFISPKFRKDPLALYKMYQSLVPVLKLNGLAGIISIPNATSYPYWKQVVNWQDVGDVNYWIVPVRLGNVLDKGGCVLNAISICYAHLACAFATLFSLFSKASDGYRYRICPDDVYVQSKRKSSLYNHYACDGYEYTYRIVDEERVKTAYVLEATKDGKRSASCFVKAVRRILQDKVDIIIYVGKMGICQLLFTKVPKRFEPKRLPFMIDIYDKEADLPGIGEFQHWDCGLINYDVR